MPPTLTPADRKRIRSLLALAVGSLFFLTGLGLVIRAYITIFRSTSFHAASNSADLLALAGSLIVLGGTSATLGARWMHQLQPPPEPTGD